MAVLGVGGRLFLRREAPSPCLINESAIDAPNNVIRSICEGYWNGDHISVDCLPVPDPVFPPDPDGYASYYGSKWFLGPNRTQITSNQDAFYKTNLEEYPDGQFGDDAQFYCREGDSSGGDVIPPCKPRDYWIHIDALGQVSFYTSRCAALSGCPEDRVEFESVGGGLTIAPYGHLDYSNAVWQCVKAKFGDYEFSDFRDSVTLVSICADPPLYQKPVAGTGEYDNANLLPRGANQGKAAPLWEVLCEVREWSLELSAPAVDTTSVAEKFGNSVKSLVTGGGSTEFFIDRACRPEGESDGLELMKLLLMTEKGAKAEAQFWMIDRPSCETTCGLVAGDLYYSTEILVTQTAVNLRPTEIVAGTAQFVTTGEIRLVESS